MQLSLRLLRKLLRAQWKTITSLVCCQLFLKYMKNYQRTKSLHAWIKYLSKYQRGIQKGYSAQHILLAMLEKWERAVDQGKLCGVLLADLSRTFSCLPYELLVNDWLSERRQRTKVNNSTWEDILFAVPQGLGRWLGLGSISVKWPVPHSNQQWIYKLCGWQYYIHKSHETVNLVITSLQNTVKELLKWFSNNQMKGNTG